MIDNFDLIKPFLIFDSEDDFYYASIIQRKKENPELGRNSYVVKSYFVSSIDYLDKNKGEMICLANYHNARVTIGLNRRSFEKIAFHTLRKTTAIIMNKNFPSVRRSYDSVCSAHKSGKDKKWIIDIDVKDMEVVKECIFIINSIKPEVNKYYVTVPTKNGYHLICSPFNKEQYSKLASHSIHCDNPTILYIPD